MTTLLWAALVIAALLVIASLVCHFAIVVAAFRDDLVAGIFSLVSPPYALYWAVKRFQHPRRRAMMWLWIGGPAIAAAIVAYPTFLAFEQRTQAIQHQMTARPS